MKKLIEKHIEKKHYVTIETGRDDIKMDTFHGYIHEQTDDLILISSFIDFNYAGLVIIKKEDIVKIKFSESDKFFNTIFEYEGLKDLAYEKRKAVDLILSDLISLCERIMDLNVPVNLDGQYNGEERFVIGPIIKVGKKFIKIKHFDSCGEFDLQPTKAKFKDITFITIDDPYSNLIFKYARESE